MANVITTKLDLDGKGFISQLRSVKASIDSADTATGKLKAGVSGMAGVLKQNLAVAATAAGTAMVTFGVKSAQSFANAALEAGKFADATGISAEQASRLREVAGDLGIEVDAVQSAVQRFNKAASDGSVEVAGFGETIVRAKNGTVDAYESFINAATAIGDIADPTLRAKAAQETFGKSYAQIAELMAMDAASLRQALANVSDAKIIDDEEVAKARQFRESMDNLQDKLEDLAMALGESLLPQLTNLAEQGVAAAENFNKLYAAAVPVGEALAGVDGEGVALEQTLFDMAPAIEAAGLNFEKTFLAVTNGEMTLEELNAKLVQAGVNFDWVAGMVEQGISGLQEFAGAVAEATQAENVFTDAAAAAAAAGAGQATSAENLRRRLSSLLGVLGEIPATKYTEITTAINEGDLNRAESLLNELARTRFATVGVQVVNGAAWAAGRNIGSGVMAGVAAAISGIKIPSMSSSAGGGGGGGGGASSPAETEAEMWDKAIAKAYDYAEITRQNYIDYLTQRMEGEDKYSEEHYRLWKIRDGLEKEIAKEAEAARREQERAEKEAADEAKRRAEDLKRAADEAKRASEQLTINVYSNSLDPMAVARAIEQAKRMAGKKFLE